jgi:hypothetical protein
MMETTMTMNRPEKVRVGAVDFDVLWCDNAWFRSANACAQFDAMEQTIRVYENGSPSMLACRFAHEVAHAVIWYNGNDGGDTVTMEQAADAAGYQLTDFWRSNPDAFAWYAECIMGG